MVSKTTADLYRITNSARHDLLCRQVVIAVAGDVIHFQALQEVSRHAHLDREIYVLCPAWVQHTYVYPEYMARRVEQWPASVSAVDWRCVLQLADVVANTHSAGYNAGHDFGPA